MARVSLLVAFSLLALAAGDAGQSCSSGAEEAALLQMSSNGKRSTADTTGGCPCSSMQYQMNFDGSNMAGSQSDYYGTQDDCEHVCASTTGCQGWTWMQSTQTGKKQCWLKNGNPTCPMTSNNPSQTYNNMYSGYCDCYCGGGPGPTPAPPSPPSPSSGCSSMQYQMNFDGNNMPESQSSYDGAQDGCQQLCASTTGCQGWTWMKSTQTSTKQCWLKNGNPTCPMTSNNPSQTYNDMYSGYCDGYCGR